MYCAIKNCSKLADYVVWAEGENGQICAEACEEHKELVQSLLSCSPRKERRRKDVDS